MDSNTLQQVKLNTEQQEAVLHTEGPLLILAGAGSGKTRVLTHRAAYLMGQGVKPWNILAITFTNKAAGEMRERIDQIAGMGSESVWVSTFHSMCVRILRRFIDRLGFDTSFSIYDTDDQKSVMKDVCKKLEIDTKITKERTLLAAISRAKDELVSPAEMALNAGNDFYARRTAEAYQEYQAQLRRNNALDFDDLIMKTVELFQNCPEVLDNYQERFRYIYRDKLVRDTVYVNHTDTISEPYPVEKQLSRWEQMKLELGGLAIGLIIAAVIALAVAAWRRYFL